MQGGATKASSVSLAGADVSTQSMTAWVTPPFAVGRRGWKPQPAPVACMRSTWASSSPHGHARHSGCVIDELTKTDINFGLCFSQLFDL